MTKIGIISDTHGYLDENVFKHFEQCDEIWHAGDFGNIALAEQLSSFKLLRGVYGNIDGNDIRSAYPEETLFSVEQVPVFMQHIAGYPGRYAPGVKDKLKSSGAKLFISGHSHILKVMYDDKLQCLHINPGAAGRQGWHKVRTIIRLVIDGTNMRDCEVIELGAR
ncbi:MAG: metallophosphoesterase family protein [Chitinophagaceae bacterium]|nr:metallophosphoesterase family protein [Chitinophagaceae bacterium]